MWVTVKLHGILLFKIWNRTMASIFPLYLVFIVYFLCFYTAFSLKLSTFDFPPTEGRYVTSRPLGQLSKTTRCVKFLWKKSRIFILKDDKIVNNYFFREIILDHEFPQPILPTKHPLLCSGCFVGKISVEEPLAK